MARILPHSCNSLERALTSKEKLYIGAVVASRHFFSLLRWIVCLHLLCKFTRVRSQVNQACRQFDRRRSLYGPLDLPKWSKPWKKRLVHLKWTIELWHERKACGHVDMFIHWKGNLRCTWKHFKRQNRENFVPEYLSWNNESNTFSSFWSLLLFCCKTSKIICQLILVVFLSKLFLQLETLVVIPPRRLSAVCLWCYLLHERATGAFLWTLPAKQNQTALCQKH